MWHRFRNYAVAILLFQLLIILLGSILIINMTWAGERVANALKAPPRSEPAEMLVFWIEANESLPPIETILRFYDGDITQQVVLVQNVSEGQFAEARDTLETHGIPVNQIVDVRNVSTISHDFQTLFTSAQVANAVVFSEWFHGRRSVCTVQAAAAAGSVPVQFVGTQSGFAAGNWWSSEAGVVGIATELAKTAYSTLAYGIPFSGCWSGDFPFSLVMGYTFAAFILSGLLVGALRWITVRRNLLDVANARSMHKIPTPRGGGIVISLLTLTMLIVVAVYFSDLNAQLLIVYILAALALTFLSLYDDWIKAVPIKVRLLLHFVAAVAVVGSTFMLKPAAIGVEIPGVIALMVTGVFAAGVLVVWITGFTNMFNFMDGIDGIAGLHVLLVGAGWALLFFLEGESTLTLISVLIVATSAGFLVHNTAPARIFMGDSGSVFLGFTLASLPVLGYVGTSNPDIFVVGMLFVLPFLFDATYTIIKRWRDGENVLQAHRKHLYQRLVLRGHSHGGVTGLYGFMSAFCVASGVLYYTGGPVTRAVALIVVILLMTVYVFGAEMMLAVKSTVYTSQPASISADMQVD